VEDALVFNPTISDRSAEQVPRTQAIDRQAHCRIAEIISGELAARGDRDPAAGGPIPATVTGHVAASATIEYTTDAGTKRRRRVHQPLLACFEHVLKLSGFPPVPVT
jgi:hypothetical protein